MSQPIKIAVVQAGTSDPSTTQLLGQAIIAKVVELGKQRGLVIHASVIDLKALAGDISTGLTTGIRTAAVEAAAAKLLDADGIIAATPIYKAGPSALFTGFFQVLDNDLLIGKPVILAATAGSDRHSLVIDAQIRPLFAYLRTITMPTALFATADDWSSPSMSERIGRAVHELMPLLEQGYSQQIRENAWQAYQHSYGSAGGSELNIDLDSDMMRLATGG